MKRKKPGANGRGTEGPVRVGRTWPQALYGLGAWSMIVGGVSGGEGGAQRSHSLTNVEWRRPK